MDSRRLSAIAIFAKTDIVWDLRKTHSSTRYHKTRLQSDGLTQADERRMAAVRGAAAAEFLPWPNALIRPIIQVDESPTTHTEPGPFLDHEIHIPAVESWVDFDQLRQGSAIVSTPPPKNKVVKTEDEDFQMEFHPAPAGKRNGSTFTDPPAKRVKKEEPLASEPHNVEVFSTSLSFRLESDDEESSGKLKDAIFRDVQLSEVLPMTKLEAAILLRHSAVEVKTGLSETGSSLAICVLPIVNTQSEVFPQTLMPWRITNGPWLQAALQLARSGIIQLKSTLHIESLGTVLRLEITGTLGKKAFIFEDDPLSSHSEPLGLLMELMQLARFASVDSNSMEESYRKRRLDASAIYSVLSPAQVDGTPDLLQPPDLFPTLLPFQRRSTAFLLGREGRKVTHDTLVDLHDAEMTSSGLNSLGTWWYRIHDGLYYNCLTGAFTTKIEATRYDCISGALLAEEMGLGKTVEILALTLLNAAPRRRISQPAYEDPTSEVMVKPVKATLIVCPSLLQKQWVDEIRRHAPSLNVYLFAGHVQATRDTPKRSDWHEFAASFDIIVVSFTVLQRELSVAMKENPRSRRAPRKYERPRCPLIQLEFFRVVCDEIQMVGNTTSAAEVVSMIPRVHSIAVSGTPVKHINDLQAFFRFLRIGNVHPNLLKGEGASLFAPHLFRALTNLTTRHLKSAVKDELTLPRQDRYVMPIDFTAVETAYYEDVWNAALLNLGLDSQGGPTREDWQLDELLMRRQLLLLRQACTHPQVAGRVLGSGHMAQGNLRTMAEVLAFMKEQATSEMYKARNVATTKSIDRAASILQDKEDTTRHELAQVALEACIEVLQADIKGLEHESVLAAKEGPGYRFDTVEIEDEKARDDPLGSDPRNAKELARASHRLAVAQRLRLRTEHLARAAHWLGNVFYQRGELETEDGQKMALKEKEDEAYNLAEETRQNLLGEAREGVERISRSSRRTRVQFGQKEMVEDPARYEKPTILGKQLFDLIRERIQLLNDNSAAVFEWRKNIIEALYTPVNREVSTENEDDDQYAEALDTQHNAEVLLQSYRPLLARRQAILTHQVAVGATDTPAALKDLEVILKLAGQNRRRAQLLGQAEQMPDQDVSFEQQVLGEVDASKLLHYRKLVQQMEELSLPSLQSEKNVKDFAKARALAIEINDSDDDDEEEEGGKEPLSGALTKLQAEFKEMLDRANVPQLEEAIIQEAQKQLRAMLKHQNGLLDALRKELDAFARIFNSRAEYFKQLQALSDALVDMPVAEGKLVNALREMQNEQDNALVTAKKQESRLRYLDYLGKMEAQGLDAEARKCIICTDEINIGLLLSTCGHIVCQKCFGSWYSTNKTCPICRAKISGPNDYHRVVYSRPEDEDEQRGTNGDASSTVKSSRAPKLSFNVVPLSLRRQIEQVPCLGRYGSKLEMLVRHLVYISRQDASEKTIVFSAFARGLELVSDALRQNGLRYVHVSGSGGGANTSELVRRFTEGDTSVMLLHSEATSAGLNLMATKNIIMLEPLVNSGAERQALGRIHRIGQTKETNVFVYYVRDSVEERILSLAAHRGQSLFLKPSSIESAESELDSGQVIADNTASKKERGDYVNSTDDLLSCFFSEHFTGDHSSTEISVVAPSSNQGQGQGGDARPLSDAEHARAARLEAIRRRELVAQQSGSTSGHRG
ncbi:unnamed protein product [Sympodiomycopsis kandeliae]